MVKKAVFTWACKLGTPKKILLYRDGVSDGEFSQVDDVEVKAVRGAVLALGCDKR